MKIRFVVNLLVVWGERNRVFATTPDFLIPSSLKHNVVDLRYFKL